MDRKLTVTHTEWSIMELLWDEPRTLMELVNTLDDRKRVDRL